VILNPRLLTEEERRELMKRPADRHDERWLEIPTFLRRQANIPGVIPAPEGFQDEE